MSRRSYVANLFGLAVVTFLLGLARSSTAGPGGASIFNTGKIRRVRDLIFRNYVEEIEDFDMKLYLGALRGMTDVLDPHSQFLSPEQRENLQIDTQGKFGGLGIVIEKPMGKLGPIIVITPFLGTPASKAGMQPGDRIVEIEGESTIGIDIEEAVEKLRGEPGTTVRIKIRHAPRGVSGAVNAGRVLLGCRLVSIDGESMAGRKVSEVLEIIRRKRGERVQVTVVPELLGEPEELVIERSIIHVPTVQFARMADAKAKIGYVYLARFQQDSTEKLKGAIEELLARGMRAFVLDLRGNPGGLLSEAIEVAELFLPKGAVIVSTQTRGLRDKHEFKARHGGPYSDARMPMAILVDGSTASASEIVAAAVRDNKRGIIVGVRTFGKGSVQKPFPIVLGRDPETGRMLVGSLKLTIEKYFTPGHVSIQREPNKKEWGVEPNIVVEMTDAEYIDLRRQWERDKVSEQEGEGVPEGRSTSKKTARAPDRPLERAMEHLRVVLFLERE